MDWFVLGIEPTKDKKAITAAYRNQLRNTNPEDKPEEFKALRAAYEEALRLADMSEETVADSTPVGLWTQRLSALYSDYASRIRRENWETLLADDVVIGLDTKSKAEEALLAFLMEDYFIPQSVWQLLDEVFHLCERREELYETYPREFIDHAVINGIRFDATLPYDMFVPGVNAADCDTYRRLYYQANQCKPEEAPELIAKIDSLSETHPYGQALKYRYYLDIGRAEEAEEGMFNLVNAYPDNVALNSAWASICLEDGNIEAAESYAQKVLSMVPDHDGAKQIVAQCWANTGKLREAKDLVLDIIRGANGDPAVIEQMSELMHAWNESLIEQYTASLQDDPDNAEMAIELGWCYLQNERFEEAMEVALQIDPDCKEQFDYHNLLCKLHSARQEYAESLDHVQQLVKIIQEMQPDGSDVTDKRIRRLPEMLQIEGVNLMQLGRMDEAQQKLEQALELAPNDPEVLNIMGRALFANAQYERCIEILTRMTEVAPDSWHAYVMMSMAYYKLRNDSEAYDTINHALQLASNDLSSYLIKMQLLIRNGAYEEAQELVNFLQENGLTDNLSVAFAQAQLIELRDEDAEEAFKRYQEMARSVEAGDEMFWTSQLYYHMAVIMGRQMDIQNPEDFDILVSVINKGLAYDEFDEDCLNYMAWLYKRTGRIDEALNIYHALEEKQPHSITVKNNLAELYYEELDHYADKALEYYEWLLERKQTPALYYFAATCKRHLGDLTGAERYYKKEMLLDPDDIDAYNGLAFVYEVQNRYGDALQNLDKAISIMDETENQYMWLIEHKVKILRRQGDHQKALLVVQEAMRKYQYPQGYRLSFEVCCQFGLWEQALQYLDAWKKDLGNDPYQIASTARFHLLQGKMFKASVAMAKVKHKLEFEEIQDFRLQLNELECNAARQIQIWDRRVRSGYDITRSLMSLAQVLWFAGKKSDARTVAEKALEELDAVLQQHLTDEALYRSRKSLVLAILGREAEAREELAHVRAMPLCEFCEYGRCKDADIYEAAIEDICSNRSKALELYRAGRKNWPDELDFMSGEARLKRKTK